MNWTLLLFFSLFLACVVEGDLKTNSVNYLGKNLFNNLKTVLPNRDSYRQGEEVILWGNRVGPLNNPQEIYPYYSIPFCRKDGNQKHYDGLGAKLQGYDLRQTPIDIRFLVSQEKTSVCTVTIDKKNLKKFETAVKADYWYQSYLDDLPVWGKVGAISDEGDLYVRTHTKFIISYNQNRIIEVEVILDGAVKLELEHDLEYTYEVKWKETTTSFNKRFEKYLDDDFFEHQIHWFSVFNSFLMVFFLSGLVGLILLRTLKKDIAQFQDNLDDDPLEDFGWKQLHGDVFRKPPHLMLLSALIGTGIHIATTVVFAIFFAAYSDLYEDRGSQLTAFLLCYASLAALAGYYGGSFYSRNGGRNWIKCVFMTSALFPWTCFLTVFLLNWIPYFMGISATSFGSMVSLFLLWALIDLPLTFIGFVIGKNWNGTIINPCRVSPVAHLPSAPKKWYATPTVNIIVSGILPFGSIFIEIYFIFTSFWHYKYYYVYGLMFLIFLILILVTMCVSVVSTYFLLNTEDPRWHWVSFFSGSSCAGYVYLFAIYYFFTKTGMTGFYQTLFYFAYMLLFCLGLGILTGSVGFLGAQFFVYTIYRYVKID